MSCTVQVWGELYCTGLERVVLYRLGVSCTVQVGSELYCTGLE